MLAFKNDPKLKDFYVARVEAHRKADEIARGFYWREGRGCAIGCLAHVDSNAHATLERDTNIPVSVAYLADRIFENLPDDKYKAWPTRFTKAVKVGSDLSSITTRFMCWLLIDELPGFFDHARFPLTLSAVQKVAELYKRKLNGEVITNKDWPLAAVNARKTRDADADADADAAADADADAAAAAAAYAAYADAAAADAAAYAAAYADAAAQSKFYSRMADKLVELLEAA